MVVSQLVFQTNRNNRRVCRNSVMNFLRTVAPMFLVICLKAFNLLFVRMRNHPSQWGIYHLSMQNSSVFV